MAHKTPVIATTRGGIAEIIRRTRTGVVVPPGNKDALIDAILTVLSEKEYKGYSERAYNFATKNAKWDISVDRMLDAICNWINEKPVRDDYTDYSIDETLLPYESVIHTGIL